MLKSIAVSIIGVLVVVALCGAQEQSSPLTDGVKKSAGEFEKTIRPLLVKYCADCHEPGAMKQFDFLTAKRQHEAVAMKLVFASVVRQMEQNTMPPRDAEQPSEAERTLIVDWIKENLFDEAERKEYLAAQVSDYIVEIYEDKRGHLWFGTVNHGVVHYDGQSLQTLTTRDGLPSNAVPSLTEDLDGNLWIGTQEGICRYDGKTITNFGQAEGLPARGGNVFKDKNGQIWANMYLGLYRYDGKSFEEFKLPIQKESLQAYAAISGRASLRLRDRAGNLWFSTNGAGVFKFDGKSFTQYTSQHGLCTNFVTGIVEDRAGNLWFSCLQDHSKKSGDGGLCRFDGQDFTTFPNTKGLTNNDIYLIYEDQQGNLWIGATGLGVYRYDGQTFEFFANTDRMDLTWSLGLQSALEDRNGNLWLGFSGGLFRFDGKAIVNVNQAELLNTPLSKK
jgi:ligand-binding sensor domain-containing protein